MTKQELALSAQAPVFKLLFFFWLDDFSTLFGEVHCCLSRQGDFRTALVVPKSRSLKCPTNYFAFFIKINSLATLKLDKTSQLVAIRIRLPANWTQIGVTV